MRASDSQARPAEESSTPKMRTIPTRGTGEVWARHRGVAMARGSAACYAQQAMSESREVRCYDYVTVPYDRVRPLLHSDAAGIFARATATANDRVRELMATLRLNVGPVEVGVDVQLKLGGITDEVTAVGDPRTRLEFTWQAAKSAGLFPTMEATLSAYPLSPSETQLDLQGRYRPPLGTLGTAIDATVGHRVAEATLLRLLRDVRTAIITELGTVPGAT